jgi:hypothetical protein
MNELDQKKLIVSRIISHLNPVPANAGTDLMQQPLKDLQVMLERLATKRESAVIEQSAKAEIDELRRTSQAESAWTFAVRNIWLNGRRLAEVQSNRDMLENMLQPHEEPTGEIYKTLALTYPPKFAWEVPPKLLTDVERRAEFETTCRANNLSLCAANEQLHKDGVGIEHWAGASQIELQKFQAEAAGERQRFLIREATPEQLKAEAQFQFATEHAAAVSADATRRAEYVAEVQKGLYGELPTVNSTGEALDAKYFRRISTTDYQLFKNMVRRFGCAQITDRLRTA